MLLTTQGGTTLAINECEAASPKPLKRYDPEWQTSVRTYSIIGGHEFNKNHCDDCSQDGRLGIYRVPPEGVASITAASSRLPLSRMPMQQRLISTPLQKPAQKIVARLSQGETGPLAQSVQGRSLTPGR